MKEPCRTVFPDINTKPYTLISTVKEVLQYFLDSTTVLPLQYFSTAKEVLEEHI